MEGFLARPVPIVFAVCQGVQQLANGGINLLGIFDRMTVHQLPDGTLPDTVSLQVLTMWTGGQGTFTHVLRLLDQDGRQILETRAGFALPNTSHRHIIVDLIAFPVREGTSTLAVFRGDDELLRQDFTIEVGPFPGTAR